MGAEQENPIVMLKQCIEEGRVDVLRSIMSQMTGKSEFHNIVDDPNATDKGTLLHLACSLGGSDSVRALLHGGVNPCVQNDDGKTAMQLAQDLRIKQAFVQELLQAVATSNLIRVCQLLSAGVLISSVDTETSRNTPLHWAASFGNIDVLKVLLEGGADLNAANAKGDTPLHDAINRGQADIVKKLLESGAQPLTKNKLGNDCFAIAGTRPEIVQCLSLHSVTRQLNENHVSNGDLTDNQSVTSLESYSNRNIASPSFHKSDRFLLRQTVAINEWTELLWPQPNFMEVQDSSRFYFKGNKVRVCFDPMSVCDPARMMNLWQLYNPLLSAHKLALEWSAWRDRPTTFDYVSNLPLVACAVLPHLFTIPECYSIYVTQYRIELFAADLAGMKMAMSTILQIIRAYFKERKNKKNAQNDEINNKVNNEDTKEVPEEDVCIPCLTIRDKPDTRIRAVFVDMSGCRVFTADTLTTIMSRLAFCKANTLVVHFEVRPTDRFSLPYTTQDIFHLQQMCEQLEVSLVPSLDLSSDNIDTSGAAHTIATFFNNFPPQKGPKGMCHFGVHLTSCVLRDRYLLDICHEYSSIIMLDIDSMDDIPNMPIPAFCMPAVNSNLLMNESVVESLCKLNSASGLCVKLDVHDVGFLCQAPETMVKNSILAAKLANKTHVNAVMVCDMSTGCEIVPQSLSYLSEMSVLGASWNRNCDMKQFAFILPNIAAEHILGDDHMTPLFQQMLTMGYIEHELTRLSVSPNNNSSSVNRAQLSIFVQLILNPDNLGIERLTPLAFKKAKMELSKCVSALNKAKKDLPYNFELALTVAEIQNTAELMILAAKLGQALCVHGNNPHLTQGSLSSVNVGVANLPLTTRTDLANSLLELRSKFQHTWLSRNKAETLHNALKLFDNLFKTLLPPHLLDLGQQLL